MLRAAQSDRRRDPFLTEAAERGDGGHGMKLPLAALLTVAGLAGVVGGGHWTVEGAVAIARTFGVSETVIGLSLVALGTSLPELVTSLAAARHGQADLAIGNVVGSNIFNLLLVLGPTAMIRRIALPEGGIVDLAVMCGLSLILLPMSFTFRRRIARGEGLSCWRSTASTSSGARWADRSPLAQHHQLRRGRRPPVQFEARQVDAAGQGAARIVPAIPVHAQRAGRQRAVAERAQAPAGDVADRQCAGARLLEREAQRGLRVEGVGLRAQRGAAGGYGPGGGDVRIQRQDNLPRRVVGLGEDDGRRPGVAQVHVGVLAARWQQKISLNSVQTPSSRRS